VPAVVTNEGGPKFIIRNGETGFAASDVREFFRGGASNCNRRQLAGGNANRREQSAMSVSWDAVFENV